MKDASTSLTKALPNANASNTTSSIDLGVDPPASGGFSNKWRLAYVLVSIPALSDHTDSTKTNTFTLQDSADNSSFANTSPLVQVQLPGVATTGSAATAVKVPLPPGVRRYAQFSQAVPTGGGTGSNATVTYDLVT